MDERQVEEALIDVCPTCHGLWLDWFDGDTLSLTYGVMPLSMRAPIAMPADATCPRDTTTLEARSHEGGGPLVYRCGECHGTFVPHAAAEALLEWSPPPSTKPAAEEDQERTILERLVTVIRSVFGGRREA